MRVSVAVPAETVRVSWYVSAGALGVSMCLQKPSDWVLNLQVPAGSVPKEKFGLRMALQKPWDWVLCLQIQAGYVSTEKFWTKYDLAENVGLSFVSGDTGGLTLSQQKTVD